MHDSMQVELAPKPQIKREIMMRRHQIRIVIGALGVNVVAARRLHADHNIAEAMQGKAEFSRNDMRVMLRFFPSRLNGTLHARRQSRERSGIFFERPRYTTRT